MASSSTLTVIVDMEAAMGDEIEAVAEKSRLACNIRHMPQVIHPQHTSRLEQHHLCDGTISTVEVVMDERK